LADASSKRDDLASELGRLLAEAQAEGVGSAKEAEGQLKKLRVNMVGISHASLVTHLMKLV
jgi:hypothetical protein